MSSMFWFGVLFASATANHGAALDLFVCICSALCSGSSAGAALSVSHALSDMGLEFDCRAPPPSPGKVKAAPNSHMGGENQAQELLYARGVQSTLRNCT